jgi:superfamily II DNA or RNA helicase
METLLQQGTNYEIYVRDIIKEKYVNSWLWKDIPSNILLELEFIKDIKNKCDDIGCDILCKKETGEYVYIQCKNYSTLGIDNTITINDLSGFYNFVAENSIKNPIVYYSGVLSSQIQCRKKKIQYINLPYVKIGNKDIKPRDYQIEAYNKLQTEHRTILEMPCGTGKTLITYLISLNYQNIILLSPLISTTEQLIIHYKNYYSTCKEPINYTIINSQNTRDINTIELSQNKNIIGSTFHSCDIINKLLEKIEGSTFIIIDEYHNLSNTNLTDVNNEINKLLLGNYKILFVSATPKQYNNEYSNIFGTIKYTLDWKYAIENKYICDYNFYYPNNDKIIEHITNIKFDTSIIEKTILINKAFFLLESIKTINIKKCIVYLKSIKEAELFENILKTINIYFELTLGIYNINYNTSRTKRNISLTKFRNNKTKISIMLNVHILDEGIDIPECDSVYLTHPNNNPVNIIQRISRANRLTTNKNQAHILLWTKNKTNLDNIIKQIKEYIPIMFNNIKNKYINSIDDNINVNDINDTNNKLINKNILINNIILFLQNNYNTDIIILIDNNNKLWFSYSNILKSIGYKDAKTQKKRINIEDIFFDTYENIYNKTKLNTKNTNIQPATKMIHESGIYLLLSKSNKKMAKQLLEHLFMNILPSLRNTDIYTLEDLK